MIYLFRCIPNQQEWIELIKSDNTDIYMLEKVLNQFSTFYAWKKDHSFHKKVRTTDFNLDNNQKCFY